MAATATKKATPKKKADDGPNVHDSIEALGSGESNFTADLKQVLHALADAAGVKAPTGDDDDATEDEGGDE